MHRFEQEPLTNRPKFSAKLSSNVFLDGNFLNLKRRLRKLPDWTITRIAHERDPRSVRCVMQIICCCNCNHQMSNVDGVPCEQPKK